MAKMCNCKRDFITPGRCCCRHCDADRKYDEYYLSDLQIVEFVPTEPIRQPARKHTRNQRARKGNES